MSARLRTSVLALVACVVAPSTSRAEELPFVRLEVFYAPGIELVCPDEETIKNAVSARLGYEPFDAAAPRRLTARVSRVGTDLVGEVRLTDDAGSLLGERRLDGGGADCMELSRALELAISIAIDPRAMLRPSPSFLLPDEEGPPPPPKERGRQMPVDTTPPPPGLVTVQPVEVVRVWNVDGPLLEGPPPPDDYGARLIALGEARAIENSATADDNAARAPAETAFRSLAGTKSDGSFARVTVSFGGLGALGTTPTPTLGNTLGFGLSFRYVGFLAEFQANLPSLGGVSSSADDQVFADLRMLTFSVCGAYDWFFACGGASHGFHVFGGQSGTLYNIGGVTFGQAEQVRPYLGLQGRLGVDVPILWFLEGLADHVRLRFHGDVNAHALQWHLRRPPSEASNKAGETLWLVPPVGFTAGAQLVVGFP
jgi:hypothetical protein